MKYILVVWALFVSDPDAVVGVNTVTDFKPSQYEVEYASLDACLSASAELAEEFEARDDLRAYTLNCKPAI